MNRVHGLAAFCLLSLAAACDPELCPAFDDTDFEDVDAKEAPEPYAVVAAHQRDVDFDLVPEERAIEMSASFEVTRVRSESRVTCDSSEVEGYVVDALAQYADAEDELSFALPVHLYLSQDEPSDPKLAFIPGLYEASQYPMALPLTPEVGMKLAGAQVTHESNGPGEARMILEAWWVAEECDNPNTCPTETFEMVGSIPMDRIVFENAL